MTCDPFDIVVLGAGAWGTALAVVLSREGKRVALVPRRAEHAAELLATRENRDYLPGVRLPDALVLTENFGKVLPGCGIAFAACPTQGLRGWSERLAKLPAAERPRLILSLAKGFEVGTHLRPTQVIGSVLPGVGLGTLSGPSNAEEVAQGRPTAVVLAAEAGLATAGRAKLVSARNLRVYTSDDLIGVELGGCLKNIYAIAAGCCDGLRLGDNAKAALLTRALAEMVRLGTTLGARPETFYGLGGVGDLMATANGSWSRNRGFGEELAKGGSIEALTKGRKSVVEGHRSTLAFKQLCDELGIEAPILSEVHAVLFAGKSPAAALESLMSRDLKRE
jgi:glycerol-3-phosphate dehydrogenase (NAD(P)+)